MPGRPQDARKRTAMMEAALDLLRTKGYEALTLTDVAQHAGTTTPALYRRWTNKVELVAEALADLQPAPRVAPSGSVRADLHALADALTASDARTDAPLVLGLLAAIHREPPLRKAFDTHYLAPRIASIREVLTAAVDRGELPPGAGSDDIALLFSAVTLQDYLVLGHPPDRARGRQVMDDVVLPLARQATHGTEEP